MTNDNENEAENEKQIKYMRHKQTQTNQISRFAMLNYFEELIIYELGMNNLYDCKL